MGLQNDQDTVVQPTHFATLLLLLLCRSVHLSTRILLPLLFGHTSTGASCSWSLLALNGHWLWCLQAFIHPARWGILAHLLLYHGFNYIIPLHWCGTLGHYTATGTTLMLLLMRSNVGHDNDSWLNLPLCGGRRRTTTVKNWKRA